MQTIIVPNKASAAVYRLLHRVGARPSRVAAQIDHISIIRINGDGDVVEALAPAKTAAARQLR